MYDKLERDGREPPATADEIAACERALGIVLPDDLKAFLSVSNGYNGDVGDHYLVLWSLDEIVASAGYEFFPVTRDRFLIGSNGGPTAFGVIDGRFVSIPFVASGPISEETRFLGDNFPSFIDAIARGEGW